MTDYRSFFFIAVIATTLQSSLIMAQASAPRDLVLKREAGWAVPSKLITGSVVRKRGEKTIEGIVATYEEFDMPGTFKDPTVVLPRVVLRDGGVGEFSESNYRVDAGSKWTHEGKLFCLWVTLVPVVENRRYGGTIGIKILAALYDDNGDGVFETLEYPRKEIHGPRAAPRAANWMTVKK